MVGRESSDSPEVSFCDTTVSDVDTMHHMGPTVGVVSTGEAEAREWYVEAGGRKSEWENIWVMLVEGRGKNDRV